MPLILSPVEVFCDHSATAPAGRPFPSWQSQDREHFPRTMIESSGPFPWSPAMPRSITIKLPVAGVTSSMAFSTAIGFVVEGSGSVNNGPENSPAAS